MQGITQAIDSGDGVFIGGKHLHHTFKPMTNNELTLDQLSEISGGSLLALLFAGCSSDDSESKKSKKDTTWVDIGSSKAIYDSGSQHKHPVYPGSNSKPSSSDSITECWSGPGGEELLW